jgi:hypothetical protein
MSLPGLSLVTEFLHATFAHVGDKLAGLFLSLGTFSLASWFTALCVAVLFLGFRRQRSRRQLPLKVLARALFPRKLLESPSSAADVFGSSSSTSSWPGCCWAGQSSPTTSSAARSVSC